MKRSTMRIACRTCSGWRGEKTTHTVGSAVPSIMDWPSSSKQAVMASCSLNATSKDGKGGSS